MCALQWESLAPLFPLPGVSIIGKTCNNNLACCDEEVIILKREWLKAGFRRLNNFCYPGEYETNIVNHAGTCDELHVILPKYRVPSWEF